jgi:phospholipid/cholesterol/gamma-HCH transport system substrate-binding protein
MVPNRLVYVGAFVIAGVLLFAAGLFFIGSRRMLFDRTFGAYAEFANIGGLQKGAIVRVAGMGAGEVGEIHVPGSPSARFRVYMRLREDLHPLIRVDSVATIQTDGLVGNKYVQVDAGTDKAPIVQSGGTMQSREPFDVGQMIDRLSRTLDLATTTVVEIRSRLEDALVSATDTANAAQELLTDVSKDARAIMASSQRVAADLKVIVANLRQGHGSLGKFLTDDELYATVKKIAAEAEKAALTLRQAGEQARGAIADFRGDQGPLKGVSADVQQTLASAKDAMADLAENTEALKRSFFFRGFFNERGYFDLKDVTVQQYREGALESRDRHALRIWIGSPVLFEPDARGSEQITEGGKARIDSAMSQFLKYPKDSPMVVEGYAREPTTRDQRFLLSRSRADLVRNYIVGRFGLDINYVATMPMGAEGRDSPTGDQWDGVALAMFVATSAL